MTGVSQSEEALEIWGVHLSIESLSGLEREYLQALPDELPTNEWVWAEMDRVWLDLGLDNSKPLAGQRADLFYSHPVWLMNGIFSAADPVSAAHRASIARYILDLNPMRVADFGSGFGELARQLALMTTRDDIQFFNIEPFPRRAAITRLEGHSSIGWLDDFPGRTLDVVVAQDVLEHVDDPLNLAADLCSSVRDGGHAVFANNFTPCIMCHLPHTFVLRHTFTLAMRVLGCTPVGSVPGADHALVYRVPAELRITRLQRFTIFIQVLGRVINLLASVTRGGRRKVLSRIVRLTSNQRKGL